MTQYRVFLFLKSLKSDWQLRHDLTVGNLIKYHNESFLQEKIIMGAKEANKKSEVFAFFVCLCSCSSSSPPPPILSWGEPQNG